MAQFNPFEIVYCGDRRHYYSYDGELYTETFPEEWAQSHLPNTGPKECENCAIFGHWNGVFVSYCINCAQFEYKGERGIGFSDIGFEDDRIYILLHNDGGQYNILGTSIHETYLKDVNCDFIGDKDFCDSAKILEDEKYYSRDYQYNDEEQYDDDDDDDEDNDNNNNNVADNDNDDEYSSLLLS